jgi:hypothetical protein
MDGNSGDLMNDLNDLLNTLKKNSEKSQSKINIKSEVNGVLGQSNDILNIVKTNPNIRKDN